MGGAVELEPDDHRATVCGTCGRGWDDSVSTDVTPAPAGRCPFEGEHDEVAAEATTLGYLACALWSSLDDQGEPLDDGRDVESIDAESRAVAGRVVRAFLRDNEDDLTGIEPSQIGHDLWLTRNHHGAGFWDRGLGERGERLTDATHALGEAWAYVGDNGAVYISDESEAA